MKYAVCLTFVALMSVGCGAAEEPGGNRSIGLAAQCPAPCKAPELTKRVFLMQSSLGFEPLAGSTPRLSFFDGRVRLGASCNTIDGEFAVRDEKLVVSEAGITEIGCDPAEHTQDEWLASFITASPRIELDDNTLTLTAEDATLVFLDREVADPDRPLVGTMWTIDSFITNDSVGSFAGGSESQLGFNADGTLSFSTTCNSGGAAYTVSGNQITLAKVGSTNRACMGPAAAAEEHILKVLNGEGALTFDIAAARLTLQRGSVGLGAIAK